MRGGALTALLLIAAACDQRAAAAPPKVAVRVAGLTAQPVRGTVHTVRMLLDDEGYRFEPSYLSVTAGDGVRFQMVSGVPHNVTFDEHFIAKGARAQLAANLGALGARDLAAPVVTAVDSGYVVSTSGLPVGEYLFYCAPHRSLSMHGVLTIR